MKKTSRVIFLLPLLVAIVQQVHAQSDSLTASPILIPSDTAQQVTVERIAVDSLPPVAVKEEGLICGTGACGVEHMKWSGFFAPAALMIYGLTIQGHGGLYPSYNIHQDMQSMFSNFNSPIDNYIEFVPAVAAYATGFIPGTKPRHSNGRRLWMFVQAQVLTSVAVAALKYYTHEQRPNGSDYLSFPSGHTAQAFMGAALFDVEYPGQMKGIKIGLYTLAGLTGMLAMMNDRHWANDVLFGAGVGMLSVRLLYLTEERFKKKQNRR